MKKEQFFKIGLIISIILLSFSAKSQEVANDTIPVYYVIDSSFVYDQKLTEIRVKIEAMNKKVYEVADKEKVETGNIAYRNVTLQALNIINNTYNALLNAHIKRDTMYYCEINNDWYLNGDTTKLGMKAEYDKVDKEIEALKNDAEITNVEAVDEYKKKVANNNKLMGYYRQIQTQKK